MDDLKVSNKVNTLRCMLVKNFLKEVGITVKRRLTDSTQEPAVTCSSLLVLGVDLFLIVVI